MTFIIGQGASKYGSDDFTEFVTLSGHRASASITEWGGETQGAATVKIYGMNESLMNKLTTVGYNFSQLIGKNSLQIKAGTDPKALTTVYRGSIMTAFADYNSAPDVAFEIRAVEAALVAMSLPDATSIQGVVSVDSLMRRWADLIGYGYLNVDVDIVINNPTFNGSYLDQIHRCAAAYNIDVSTSDYTVMIKQKTSAYPTVAELSPSTGMVGYPIFSSTFMSVKSLFLPLAKLGGQLKIKDSSILAVNGTWLINTVQHELETLTPNGKWFTTCMVTRPSAGVT
jgi:hypothetical protein